MMRLNVGFFDPMYNDESVHSGGPMEHSGENIYFRDVHLFLNRVKNIAMMDNASQIRENLNTCLRGIAMIWYISELSDGQRIFLKYGKNVECWEKELLNRFKDASNVAMAALVKEKYTMEDAKKHREPREYAAQMLRSVRAAGLDSEKAQIMLIHNGPDMEFQWDFPFSKASAKLDSFLIELDDRKNTWWHLAAHQTYRGLTIARPSCPRNWNVYRHDHEQTGQFRNVARFAHQPSAI